MVQSLRLPCWLRGLGDHDVYRDLSTTSLRLLHSDVILLLQFNFSSDFFGSGCRRVNPYRLLCVPAHLDLLDAEASAVLELEPEFSVADELVRYKAVELRSLLVLVALGSETEPEVILADDGLCEGFATKSEVVDTHDGVVVGVEQTRPLTDALHLVILDVQHFLGHRILIQLVLHEASDSPVTGGVGLWLRRGQVILFLLEADGFLLEDELVREESEPVLEVGDYAVGGKPFTLTVQVVAHRGLDVRRTTLRVGLVVQGHQLGVSSLVVHAGHVRLVKKCFSKHLFENLWLHVVLENALEDLELVVLLIAALLVINEV